MCVHLEEEELVVAREDGAVDPLKRAIGVARSRIHRGDHMNHCFMSDSAEVA